MVLYLGFFFFCLSINLSLFAQGLSSATVSWQHFVCLTNRKTIAQLNIIQVLCLRKSSRFSQIHTSWNAEIPAELRPSLLTAWYILATHSSISLHSESKQIPIVICLPVEVWLQGEFSLMMPPWAFQFSDSSISHCKLIHGTDINGIPRWLTWVCRLSLN